jgi:hypothetical protein
VSLQRWARLADGTEAVKSASTVTRVPQPLSLPSLLDSLLTRTIALVHKLYLFENG